MAGVSGLDLWRDKMTHENETNRLDGLQDFMKRTISTGVKSVLGSEDSIRKVVAELLPAELGQNIRAQLDKLREEVREIVANELRGFTEKLDLSSEIKKLMSEMTIEVKAEISLKEKKKTRKKKA